ncbi:hypothetical protein OUZ56_024281 [Daphnia magna]|uniref:Uncharacterized protein n=1 Tax=Daphnia magna TaxID=35525 RepID=A0ABR0B0J3_9CRUS|nr:hypothetical protein OUZ56_024281 [Daphnia magna]
MPSVGRDAGPAPSIMDSFAAIVVRDTVLFKDQPGISISESSWTIVADVLFQNEEEAIVIVENHLDEMSLAAKHKKDGANFEKMDAHTAWRDTTSFMAADKIEKKVLLLSRAVNNSKSGSRHVIKHLLQLEKLQSTAAMTHNQILKLLDSPLSTNCSNATYPFEWIVAFIFTSLAIGGLAGFTLRLTQWLNNHLKNNMGIYETTDYHPRGRKSDPAGKPLSMP